VAKHTDPSVCFTWNMRGESESDVLLALCRSSWCWLCDRQLLVVVRPLRRTVRR